MNFIESIANATHLLLTENLAAPLGQVNMPSYAGEKEDDPPRFVTWPGKDGSVNALLDSIQSQANRIEPIFAKFPELVPASTVKYPNGTVLSLLEEPVAPLPL